MKSPATAEIPKAPKAILHLQNEDWRKAITEFLEGKTSEEDEAKAARIQARARNYTILDGVLYKKGVVQPLLKCISQSEGIELLQEIQSGICGSHIGSRALSAKAIRQGFIVQHT